MITPEELTRLNSFKNNNSSIITDFEYMRFKSQFQYFLKSSSLINRYNLLGIMNRITDDIRWNISDF